jgi:hypothetical protein
MLAQLADDVFSSSALAPHDLLTSLLSEYQTARKRIEQTAGYMQGDPQGVLRFFVEGNCTRERGGLPDIKRLFDAVGAIAALNSHFWERTMQLTDILDTMPQARRTEWHEQISEHKCPPFEEQIVRDTMSGLMAQRSQFLAERVDGIFRGLSGEHVTNQPQGFGKRMIVANVLHYEGMVNYKQTGLINDLRAVIAKFMHRDEPSYQASDTLIRALRGNWGEWTEVDGGALRVRLYRKGTAHLEVHPDMAWRLNSVLAHLYPRAIPPQFRERPTKKPHDTTLIQRPLPFAVTAALAAASQAYSWDHDAYPAKRTVLPNCVTLSNDLSKHVRAETEAVLSALGGVQTGQGWQFDYPPLPLITSVAVSGVVPDGKTHQFYPTPPEVAARAIELAEIQPEHVCLEPSAGIGNLAALMPRSTLCIEVAALRCDVLRARGHVVEQADFLTWAADARIKGRLFDRVVMNPPFDGGRWQAHLLAASRLVKPSGRLVAILPSGAGRNAAFDPTGEWTVTYPARFDNAFAGASVSVLVMVADRVR